MYRHISSRASGHVGRSGAPGFTLIELLITLGIGLVLLGATFKLFIQSRKVMASTARITDMNQNLRGGAELLMRDLTIAAAGIPIGGVPLPGGTGCQAVKRPGPASPPATFSNCAAGSMGVLPAISPGSGLGPTINGKTTDEVTMIAVDQNFAVNNVPVALAPTSITADPVGCTSSCRGWILTVPASPSIDAGSTTAVSVNDIFMFSNSNGAALGMVTAVNPTAHTITFDQGDPLSLNQPGAAAGTLSSLGPGGVYPQTLAYKIRMISYYLDNTQSGNPRLMQQIGNSTPMAVADGINALVISYDLSDGVTTDVRDVLSVTPHTPNEIRKVNLALAANSPPLVLGLRKMFVSEIKTAVTIRDLAYRNNYK
jgi:prepilin-type N-terminal cleavage/methylation domain-containing protein